MATLKNRKNWRSFAWYLLLLVVSMSAACERKFQADRLNQNRYALRQAGLLEKR